MDFGFLNAEADSLREPERRVIGLCAVCGEALHAGCVHTDFHGVLVHDGCESDYVAAHTTAAHKQAYLAAHFAGAQGFAAYVRGELDENEWRTVLLDGYGALEQESRESLEDTFLENEPDFYRTIKEDLQG